MTKQRLIVLSLGLFGAAIYACNQHTSTSSTVTDSTTTTTTMARDTALPPAPTAFANSNGNLPPKSQYAGPLFALSHDYPTTQPPPVVNPIWQQALHGQPISSSNALAYVDSLKAYVTPNVLKFLYDYPNWNAAQNGWYNEPWTGYIREPILGTYIGSTFDAQTFDGTGLKQTMSTYVLTFYDKTAGYTMGRIWGSTGAKPNFIKDAAQFPEGSVIVKFAYTTANEDQWPVMQNALQAKIYDTLPNGLPGDEQFKVRNVSMMQFDIIVKDTKTSPKTGWVFTTLVYDKTAAGKTAWDKMVPLGAMWGNDPDVNSTINPKQPLKETVINPNAPAYSTITLGWGGRLSGPNDGAVAEWAQIEGTKEVKHNLRISSCMSCHGPAEFQIGAFLLPGPLDQPNSDTLLVYAPGSPVFRQWFQDRPGTLAQDKDSIALDYDMVTSFKSIPAWDQATNNGALLKTRKASALFDRYRRLHKQSSYNGK